jgi:hypothetical protein
VSRWLLDFEAGGGFAGFVRLELRASEARAWYWTYLVGVPGVEGVIVVRDHDVLLPRQGLEIRADGLWAELWCEAPGVHWTFGLESFGLRLDDPRDALRTGGEIGERIAVGLDIEWEVGADGPPLGIVHGDVLVGRERHAIDGRGWFYDDGTPEPAAASGEIVATVYIPLRDGANADDGDRHIERRLVRNAEGLHWVSG